MKRLLSAVKFKTFALLCIISAAVALTVSSSIALFTDGKESAAVFTVGDVYIELTEAAVVANGAGNLVEDTTKDRIAGADISNSGASVIHNYGMIFPGQTIHKDPTLKNVGTNSAWVAFKVIFEDGVGDIHKIFAYSDEYDDIDIELILNGGLLDEKVHVGTWNGISDVCYNDNYAMIQASNHSQGKYEFYFLMQKPLQTGESVELFDKVVIDPSFGNVEMQEFRELKITVQAFAVQEFGFTSCLDAMSAAFSDHFLSCIPAQ